MFAEEETSQSVCHLLQNNVKRAKYSFAKVAEFGMVEAAFKNFISEIISLKIICLSFSIK